MLTGLGKSISIGVEVRVGLVVPLTQYMIEMERGLYSIAEKDQMKQQILLNET